jgi:cobalt-zinc-cadmium efflux system outer membrane protein
VKYEVGEGLQQDVLLAQLELSKLLDTEIQLSAMKAQRVIRLNVLMWISRQIHPQGSKLKNPKGKSPTELRTRGPAPVLIR